LNSDHYTDAKSDNMSRDTDHPLTSRHTTRLAG
jgi:hypothetical protein